MTSGTDWKTPEIDTMTVSQARRQFSETLNRVYRGEARVIIEKSGIPVGAIVSPRDLADIDEMRSRRAALRGALEDTRAAFAGVPADEIEREVAKAVSEVKAEMKQERLVTQSAATNLE